jgi:preprotein translocase subunit SecE
MLDRLKNYFQEVLKEMQKVSWPSRPQLVDSTIVVVVAVLLVSVVIFVADTVISWGLQLIYG